MMLPQQSKTKQNKNVCTFDIHIWYTLGFNYQIEILFAPLPDNYNVGLSSGWLNIDGSVYCFLNLIMTAFKQRIATCHGNYYGNLFSNQSQLVTNVHW